MRQPYNQFNGFPSNQSENGANRGSVEGMYQSNPAHYHHQVTTVYPKSSSGRLEEGSKPATASQLTLPLGQYDDMRPFIVKQRNREYNSLKAKVLKQHWCWEFCAMSLFGCIRLLVC